MGQWWGKMSEYFSTQYPGIRYREHSTRKFNGKPDRYYFIRYKRSGKAIEESVGWASHGMNAQKATKIRVELVQNIKEGIRPQSLQEKRAIHETVRREEEEQKRREAVKGVTFGQIWEKYIEWAKSNKKSWRDDEQRYNSHLKNLLSEKPLNEISSFELEQLKINLQEKNISDKINSNIDKKLSPATIKHCLVLVRQIFNKAIIWEFYSGTNPVKKIKLPYLNNSRLRFLSHDEANTLLIELKKVSLIVYDQSIISLQCGLRFGEIAKLTLADLDFTHGIIQIRDPKGECRQSYMTTDVRKILLDRKPSTATSLVFESFNGDLQKSVSSSFDRVVKKIGFNNGILDRRDKIVFHSLRHTFGSWLAMQGTPLLTIKELLGHKSIEMTMRYSHLLPDQKKEAVSILADRFNKYRTTDIS